MSPAQFVHDEAQRGRRDGSIHLARFRPAASVRTVGRHRGIRELIATLEKWLVTITGYDKGEPAAQPRDRGGVRRAAGHQPITASRGDDRAGTSA